jgi:hypothetical protein
MVILDIDMGYLVTLCMAPPNICLNLSGCHRSIAFP